MTVTAAERTAILTEIAHDMSDNEWNAFVAAEKARRNATAAPLDEQQRVRFPANTRPRKLAMATGRVTARKFTNGQWKYTVKMDHNLGMGQTFIRVERVHIEVIDDMAPIVYASK